MKYNETTKRLTFTPEEVMFIDTERKNLPFREAANAKIKTVTTWEEFTRTMLDACGVNNLDQFPNRKEYYSPIRCVVVDSFTRMLYLLSKVLGKQGITGFSFWREFADILEEMLMSWSSDGRFIVFTAIDEVLTNDSVIDSRVARVDGRKHRGAIESYFNVVLHTHFDRTKELPLSYQFMTQTDGYTSAKSPYGMFDNHYIQNDMAYVLGSYYDFYDMKNNPDFKPSPILIVGRSGWGKSTSFKYLFEEE